MCGIVSLLVHKGDRGVLVPDDVREALSGDNAAACVQAEPSIACSTETALRWEAQFTANADPSGRAVKKVHDYGY